MILNSIDYLLITLVILTTTSSNRSSALKRWDKLKESVVNEPGARNPDSDFGDKEAEVITTNELLGFLIRRRGQRETYYYKSSPLLLWGGVKGELLENSNQNETTGDEIIVGTCATGNDVLKGLYKAFITDEISTEDSRVSTTTWEYIRFYPRCCSRHTTRLMLLYDFRECTPKEQTVLIGDSLRRHNQTYADAMKGYYGK